MCRVFKTVRLLHSHSSISCRVASSWACLSVVLLFVTDWRQNKVSLASIPAAVASLVEWPNSLRSQVMSPTTLIEISSQHTPINFPSRRNIFSTDFNGVPTTAASDDTDTLDAGMASPLFTQEREVNSLSGSVRRQAVVSGSSHTAAIIIQSHA